MRKIKLKPKRRNIVKLSAFQKLVLYLIQKLEEAEAPDDKLFSRILWHITDSETSMMPQELAELLLGCMDVTIRNYGGDDPEWYVTAVHTVGKYPYGGKQIRKEVQSKHLWVAASLCYLKLCLALNEKLYYGQLRKQDHT